MTRMGADLAVDETATRSSSRTSARTRPTGIAPDEMLSALRAHSGTTAVT